MKNTRIAMPGGTSVAESLPMKYIRAALTALGAFLAVDAVCAALISNANSGVVFTFIAGIILFAVGAFGKRIPKAVVIAFLSAALAAVAVVSTVIICGLWDNVSYDEDAVIVLGAGLRGENVSRSLRRRLDAAVEYHRKNPNAVIVVSGGQGEDEAIPESLAMKRYLVAAGVPEDMIVEESLSTSTKENFAFSKSILDERFGDDYSAAFITNDYHVPRAGFLASDAGLDGIAHMHAKTPPILLIPGAVRECAGLIAQCVFRMR